PQADDTAGAQVDRRQDLEGCHPPPCRANVLLRYYVSTAVQQRESTAPTAAREQLRQGEARQARWWPTTPGGRTPRWRSSTRSSRSRIGRRRSGSSATS